MADIPGLIEGAAEGAGLGHRFLKHLSRTGLLLHVVDLAPFDETVNPAEEALAIINELRKYDEELYGKPRWLVLNKLDMLDEEEAQTRTAAFLEAIGWDYPKPDDRSNSTWNPRLSNQCADPPRHAGVGTPNQPISDREKAHRS